MIDDRAARISQGKALLDAGHLDAAERIYSDLITRSPGHAAGFVGLARCAAGRKDWAQAAERWGEVLRRFPGGSQRAWRIGAARALIGAGRPSEARPVVLALLADSETDAVALFLFTRLAMAGPRAEARCALAHPALASQGVFAPSLARLRLLLWINDMPAARDAWRDAFDLARSATQWEPVFEAIPRLFLEEARPSAWRDTLHAIAPLAARPADAEEAGAFTALLLRLRLALRDYPAFLDGLERAQHLPDWFDAMAAGVARALRNPGFPDAQAPRIFGIGLMKTGTTSLTAALEMLGFSAAHTHNPFTETPIGHEDCFLFDALTDEPIAAAFEALHEAFPNARFIHTRRALPDWLESAARHLQARHGSADFAELRRLRDAGQAFHAGGEEADLATELYLVHEDAQAAYLAHEARIAGFFADKPAQKLLVHDVFAGDGWPTLCAFLGLPAPDAPYPWENRRADAA